MKQFHKLSIPTELRDLCDPSKTALLVYDMQVGICKQIAEGARILERCRAALTEARRVGMRIAFTRHLSCPKRWMGASQARTAMTWQRKDDPEEVVPAFLRASPAFEIVSELAPAADDLVLDKLSMSAFEGTPLRYILNDCEIRAVAVVGIALEIGIEPTVRHATDLAFVPIVLADACGSGNAQAGARSLETMRFLEEAFISDVDTFFGLLSGATGSG